MKTHIRIINEGVSFVSWSVPVSLHSLHIEKLICLKNRIYVHYVEKLIVKGSYLHVI